MDESIYGHKGSYFRTLNDEPLPFEINTILKL